MTLILSSCGDSDSFTIEGTVEENPSMNLRFIYQNNSALQKGITAVRDGKFEFKGVASNPTIVEILDNDFRPLGRVYIKNGQQIKCKLTRGNPFAISVSGDETSSRWASFLNANRQTLLDGSPATTNLLIEKYVGDHPEDIVSTLLMLTSYDASADALRADSVMSSIDIEARPSSLVDGFNSLLQRLVSETASRPVAPIPFYNMRDSLVDFRPSAKPLSLLALSNNSSGRADSIVPALKRLSRKSLRPKLQIVDFSTDKDTIAWHRSIRPDSASWQQGWAPGAIASPGINRLGIPAVPYFIVIDSAGNQLLRSRSISIAEAYIDSCLSAK